MNKQCEFIKQNGEQCGAYAGENSVYCISHNPEMQDVKRAAVQKGGAAENYQKLNLELTPFTIDSPSDVSSAVVQTINELRSGKVPPKIANTIGYLLGIALKAFEVAEIDRKIEAIDRVILERKVRERR